MTSSRSPYSWTCRGRRRHRSGANGRRHAVGDRAWSSPSPWPSSCTTASTLRHDRPRICTLPGLPKLRSRRRLASIRTGSRPATSTPRAAARRCAARTRPSALGFTVAASVGGASANRRAIRPRLSRRYHARARRKVRARPRRGGSGAPRCFTGRTTMRYGVPAGRSGSAAARPAGTSASASAARAADPHRSTRGSYAVRRWIPRGRAGVRRGNDHLASSVALSAPAPSLRRALAALAVAGVVACAVPLAVAIHSVGGHHRDLIAVFGPIIGGAFIGTGLFAWSRRPENRFGALMVALGFAYCLSGLIVSTDSWPFIGGLVLIALPYALLFHILLAFPSGRLATPGVRALALASYLVATLGWWVCLRDRGHRPPGAAGQPAADRRRAGPVLGAGPHPAGAGHRAHRAARPRARAALRRRAALPAPRALRRVPERRARARALRRVGGARRARGRARAAGGPRARTRDRARHRPVRVPRRPAAQPRGRRRRGDRARRAAGRRRPAAGRAARRARRRARRPLARARVLAARARGLGGRVRRAVHPAAGGVGPRGDARRARRAAGRPARPRRRGGRGARRGRRRRRRAGARERAARRRAARQRGRAARVARADRRERRRRAPAHRARPARRRAAAARRRRARAADGAPAAGSRPGHGGRAARRRGRRPRRRDRRPARPRARHPPGGALGPRAGLRARGARPARAAPRRARRLPGRAAARARRGGGLLRRRGVDHQRRPLRAGDPRAGGGHARGRPGSRSRCEDDGIGGADPGQGSGLRGLSDRVAALDGRLEVRSDAGRGTTVRATIPV